MSAGKILLTFILALLVGAIFGVVIYNQHYQLSEKIMEKYDLVFMVLPSIALFVVGYFIGGGRSKTTEFTYRPLFQGRVQQLGTEGEKIVMVALQRAGIVKESKR